MREKKLIAFWELEKVTHESLRLFISRYHCCVKTKTSARLIDQREEIFRDHVDRKTQGRGVTSPDAVAYARMIVSELATAPRRGLSLSRLSWTGLFSIDLTKRSC